MNFTYPPARSGAKPRTRRRLLPTRKSSLGRGRAVSLLLVVASLACSSLTTPLLGTPTPLPSPTATASALPSATATLVPSPTLQPTPSDTPTRTPFPTLTAAPTFTLPAVTAAPDAGQTQAHLRIFERLWDAVNTRYVYTDFNGLDWRAIGDEYRAKVEAGLTDDGFYVAMNDMLGELQDDRSRARHHVAHRRWPEAGSGVGREERVRARLDHDHGQASQAKCCHS